MPFKSSWRVMPESYGLEPERSGLGKMRRRTNSVPTQVDTFSIKKYVIRGTSKLDQNH